MDLVERIRQAQFVFLDREATIASLDLHFRADSDLDSLFAALRADGRYTAVSDCVVIARLLIASAVNFDISLPTASNLRVGSFVFVTAPPSATVISIPGIKSDYYEGSGCFANERLITTHDDIVALTNALIENEACSPRGTPITAISSGVAYNFWSELDRRSG